ncbi:PIN domain-containing protein [Candidatus Woesearchaeota archaeon]|nr:PIN domain-containing protein [Candidatus Woesearchaeota archaeon]
MRVFLDTNVFIYAFEFPGSNSAKIIGLLNEGELEAFITPQVLKEVVRYFRNLHNKELADEFRHYLLEVCNIVHEFEIEGEMQKNRGKIKDSDLQQIAAAKHLQLKLVSYDKDFENFEEYILPREFVKSLGKAQSNTKF